ncbi:hypothetical protein KPH14_005152 [Odynerus spinipes]|uniref:Uncharacterized protein n=1 Tax=Odynerus spinipes TaxID=1348599 RepID=A0AAD9RKT3_9HYME|nr:hypothetical protein KPH14_005152 [Odynerus spinipes]
MLGAESDTAMGKQETWMARRGRRKKYEAGLRLRSLAVAREASSRAEGLSVDEPDTCRFSRGNESARMI